MFPTYTTAYGLQIHQWDHGRMQQAEAVAAVLPAFEEGGHAAASATCGAMTRPFALSLLSDPTANATTHFRPGDFATMTDEECLVVALAGPLAAARYARLQAAAGHHVGDLDKPPTLSGADLRLATVALDSIAEGNARLRDKAWAECWAAAERLVNEEWPLIDRLARALLASPTGTLRGHELRDLLPVPERTIDRPTRCPVIGRLSASTVEQRRAYLAYSTPAPSGRGPGEAELRAVAADLGVSPGSPLAVLGAYERRYAKQMGPPQSAGSRR